MDITPKVNKIVRLVVELAYFKTAFHTLTITPRAVLYFLEKNLLQMTEYLDK